jgi:hypothetical protein
MQRIPHASDNLTKPIIALPSYQSKTDHLPPTRNCYMRLTSFAQYKLFRLPAGQAGFLPYKVTFSHFVRFATSQSPLSLLNKTLLTYCHLDNSNSGYLNTLCIPPACYLFAYTFHHLTQFSLLLDG